jgi:hypothetical protein
MSNYSCVMDDEAVAFPLQAGRPGVEAIYTRGRLIVQRWVSAKSGLKFNQLFCLAVFLHVCLFQNLEK